MSVNHDDWEWASFDILEELNYEDSSMCCPKDDTWKLSRDEEGLLCYLFVWVEEAMLVLAEVILCDIRIDIDDRVLILLSHRMNFRYVCSNLSHFIMRLCPDVK